MTTITLDGEVAETFEEAKALIDEDVEADAIEAEIAQRGRSAGELKNDEVVRVLAEAYLGRLEFDE